MDISTIHIRDAEFARRLRERDPHVVQEIQAAYGPPLRHLAMTEARKQSMYIDFDGDEMLQNALLETWEKYPPPDSLISVRSYLFNQVRWRTRDHLRKLKVERRIVRQASGETECHRYLGPADSLQCRESSEAESRVLQEVERILERLPERQRTAFKHRFYGDKCEHWAKDLELQTGDTASSWRKASDDAKHSIIRQLISAKVIRVEGGQYEVA